MAMKMFRSELLREVVMASAKANADSPLLMHFLSPPLTAIVMRILFCLIGGGYGGGYALSYDVRSRLSSSSFSFQCEVYCCVCLSCSSSFSEIVFE